MNQQGNMVPPDDVEAGGAYVDTPGGSSSRSGWWRGLGERMLSWRRPAKNESLWRAYALTAGERLQERLQEDDPLVDQVHAFLHGRLLKLDEQNASFSVSVRIWPDADGYVRRSIFSPLGSQQAERQLRRIVMARPLPAPPPGMPSPIELMITLELMRQGAR